MCANDRHWKAVKYLCSVVICNECVLVLVTTAEAAGLKQWCKESSIQSTTTIYVQLLLQLSRNTHRPVNWYTCICQIKNIHLSFTAELLPYIHEIHQKRPQNIRTLKK
jgi:hypothetical protein